MNHKYEYLFTKAKQQIRIEKIVQFPLIRILIAVLFLAPVSVINNLLAIYITEPLPESYSTILTNALVPLFFLLFLFAYRLYTKHIEKRETHEISRENWFGKLAGHRAYDGTYLYLLTGGGASKWSPDGLLIAFHSEGEVHTINTDGTNLQQVTNSPSGIKSINPAWKPLSF